MDWSTPTWWWLAAGVLVAAELLSGTFYLLMLALGCAAGAVLAHAGAGPEAQWTVAALCGAGATAIWHYRRASAPRSAPIDRNRDANLDIGEHVSVTAWGDDRRTRVQYRGAGWNARLAPDAPAAPGAHEIVAVQGNELILAPTPTKPN
ncbi:MAG: NfeD family protein [Burkholderiales bacterium]|nr:NfeD family protein [Burkholderiales bacterium]